MNLRSLQSGALAALLAAAVVAPVLGAGAPPPASPKATVDLTAWGLSSASAIRYLKLGLVKAAGGDQLVVYALDDRPEVAPPPGPAAGSWRPPADRCTSLWAPTEGARAALGGFFGVFQRAPSAGSLDLEGGVLRFDWQRGASGWVGTWLRLVDQTAADGATAPVGALDVSGGGELVLRLGGADGFHLQLADQRLAAADDSLAVTVFSEAAGDPSAGVDGRRPYRLPIADLPPALDRSALVSLALQSPDSGAGRLELAGAWYCPTGVDLGEQAAAMPSAAVGAEPVRALWLWETELLLRDAKRRQQLFDTVGELGLNRLYLQVPYGRDGRPGWEGSWLLRWRLGRLLAALEGRGVRVEALDGRASFAQTENHPQVLALIESVVRYNHRRGSRPRFVGVHLDVEPYLLTGFGGRPRQLILEQYLELLAKAHTATAAAGLPLAVDIPFWFDSPDERSGEPLRVDFRGRSLPPYQHILDLVDGVTVMDYRTAAWGPNGILALAENEIREAGRRGKTAVIGLESTVLPDETYVVGGGEPVAAAAEAVPVTAAGDWVYGCLGQGSTLELSLVPTAPEACERPVRWPIVRREGVPSTLVTFAAADRARVLGVRERVSAAARVESGFGGVALHSFEGWLALPAGAGPTP